MGKGEETEVLTVRMKKTLADQFRQVSEFYQLSVNEALLICSEDFVNMRGGAIMARYHDGQIKFHELEREKAMRAKDEFKLAIPELGAEETGLVRGYLAQIGTDPEVQPRHILANMQRILRKNKGMSLDAIIDLYKELAPQAIDRVEDCERIYNLLNKIKVEGVA